MQNSKIKKLTHKIKILKLNKKIKQSKINPKKLKKLYINGKELMLRKLYG